MQGRHFLKATTKPPVSALVGACPVPARATHHSAAVPTGISALNGLIQSFRNQELTVIASLPSVGNTAFVSAIACNAAIESDLPVAFFSLQTREARLTARMLGALTNTRRCPGEAHDASMEEQLRMAIAGRALCTAPLVIDDSLVLTMNQLRSRAIRLKREHGLALLILDSIEELKFAGWIGNPEGLLNARLRALKSLAVEIGAPVVVTAPVSRSIISQPNHRPRITDLEHFSEFAIEPIDLMISLHRDELYKQDSSDRGIIEVNVHKHRHGNIGAARLRFDSRALTFSTLAH